MQNKLLSTCINLGLLHIGLCFTYFRPTAQKNYDQGISEDRGELIASSSQVNMEPLPGYVSPSHIVYHLQVLWLQQN